MSRPALGILATTDTPPGVPPILHRLREWCEPRAADPAADDVAAWFATSVDAAGLRAALAGGAPVAVWVDDAEEADRALALVPRPAALVTARGDLAGRSDLVVSVAGRFDVGRYLPLTPTVRRRWRDRFGLPEPLVLRIDDRQGPVSHDLVPTAIALASAVAVQGDRLLEALAWGTPSATDAASAARVGARDGVEVVVGEEHELVERARVLAADDVRAAAVGCAGRRLVERVHDRALPVTDLATRLGLLPGVDPFVRLATALDELGTPADARIRVRALHATRALRGAT